MFEAIHCAVMIPLSLQIRRVLFALHGDKHDEFYHFKYRKNSYNLYKCKSLLKLDKVKFLIIRVGEVEYLCKWTLRLKLDPSPILDDHEMIVYNWIFNLPVIPEGFWDEEIRER